MTFRYCGFADEASRDIKEQIAVTREAGWNGIEVRMAGEKNVCSMTPDEWKELWALFVEAEVQIPSFGSALCNWSRPITTDFQVDLDELNNAIPYMHEAGARIIRVMSYPNAKEEPWDKADWKAEAVRRLKELAKIAQGEGVILGHENCSGYGGIGPKEILELLEEVNSPAFKVIFDTGNSTTHDNDHEATWRYYQAVKPEIVHVHIKSFKRNEEGKLGTCYPDEDPMQAKVLGDLKASGYDGWVSIEPHLKAVIHAGEGISDADAAKACYLEYTKRLEAVVAGL